MYSQKLLQTNLAHSLFQKFLLYFDIFTWSPTLNLKSSLLFSLSKSTYVLDFITTDFVLTVLWYAILCFLILKYITYKFCSAITDFSSLIHFYMYSMYVFLFLYINTFLYQFFLPWLHWSIGKFTGFIYSWFVSFATWLI